MSYKVRVIEANGPGEVVATFATEAEAFTWVAETSATFCTEYGVCVENPKGLFYQGSAGYVAWIHGRTGPQSGTASFRAAAKEGTLRATYTDDEIVNAVRARHISVSDAMNQDF